MKNTELTTCDNARLSEYLDGTLAAGDRTAAEAHLAACESCRAALDELRATKDALAALATPMPAGLHNGIMTAVRREKAAARRRFFLSRLAAPCAAALLVALLVPALLRGGENAMSADGVGNLPSFDGETDAEVCDAANGTAKNSIALTVAGVTTHAAPGASADDGDLYGEAAKTESTDASRDVSSTAETGDGTLSTVATLTVSRALYEKLRAALPDKLTVIDGEIYLSDCAESRAFLCGEGIDPISINVTYFRLRIDDTN